MSILQVFRSLDLISIPIPPIFLQNYNFFLIYNSYHTIFCHNPIIFDTLCGQVSALHKNGAHPTMVCPLDSNTILFISQALSCHLRCTDLMEVPVLLSPY